MVKVYFEQPNYAELVAYFADENVYKACYEALEKQAKEYNFEFITESVVDVDFDNIITLAEKLEENEPEKTYYLFGEEPVKKYFDDGFESFFKRVDDYGFETFCFIEGITKSTEFAEAIGGWMDYAVITEEEFNQLQ
jgi:hypothetical protein